MSQRSVHIIVSGKVQGVGYRWFVAQKALDFSITGWVRNLSNGEVEIIAHGTKPDIGTFIDYVKTGPSLSRVISVEVNDFISESCPDAFSIR